MRRVSTSSTNEKAGSTSGKAGSATGKAGSATGKAGSATGKAGSANEERGNGAGARRAELLGIAARLFAEKGFRNTTVRDIADAAGILSGSLYHHFDSKESMVDEILRTFQEELFGQYDEILASDDDARTKLEKAVRVSFATIDQHHHEVAIFQNDADFLGTQERFGYLAERNAQSRDVWVTLLEEGVRTGVLRSDLDVTLTFRFIRDTVWVAVRWYRPGGGLSHTDIADQYIHILLDGIAVPAGG